MSGKATDEDRKARLAAALRENLRRRKAQARGRREAQGPGDTDRPAAPAAAED
jgi:hypothetical protein